MIIRENKVSFISIIQHDELKTGQTMHFLAVGRCKSITENGELEQLANWSIKGPENSTLRLLGFVRYIVRLVRPSGKRRIWVALRQSRRGNESVKCNIICLPTEHQGVHKNSFRNAHASEDRSLLCMLREENQQQTQPTYDAGSMNRTRDSPLSNPSSPLS